MRSAGIMLYRLHPLEVYLGHPGGPFYRNMEFGVWTVPKGAIEEGESEEQAARREFEEETGLYVSSGLVELGEVKYRSGKRLIVFAAEHAGADFAFVSNEFTHRFPDGSTATYPELDRGEWFAIDEARKRIHPVQRPLIGALTNLLDR